jgi:hypothetical protein
VGFGIVCVLDLLIATIGILAAVILHPANVA